MTSYQVDRRNGRDHRVDVEPPPGETDRTGLSGRVKSDQSTRWKPVPVGSPELTRLVLQSRTRLGIEHASVTARTTCRGAHAGIEWVGCGSVNGVSDAGDTNLTLRDILQAVRDSGRTPSEDELFTDFMGWVEGRGITPYPAQEEAAMELAAGSHVVLATPTGSGKSLVALGAHFMAAATGKRSVYTAPIKALVSEKFFDLCETFGADMVGMATGDAAVNSDAPIICCTAEVLANQALRQGRDCDLTVVVMDEFHYYGDPDRGWAWQVPLLEMDRAQFLLMSATLGNTDQLRKDLEKRTRRPAALVSSATRPVPLSFWYATTPIHETITEQLETGGAPIYIVHFTQAQATERAQALMSTPMASKEDKAAIAEAIGAFKFATGFGKTLSRLVRSGIGVHHAGMLPKYRRLVEQLAQRGLLKVICGTDTLGIGINVPIRTVLMTALTKYDGRRVRQLNAREFHQIAGRAGRAGFDTAGTVVTQCPEHEAENIKALAKAGDDPKKRRKVQRKKAPEGFVNWSDVSHEKLINAEPEPLSPVFDVSFSMVLNLINRPGNAFTAMYRLLRDNHLPRKRQNALIVKAIRMYKALEVAEVVERLDAPDEQDRVVRLTVDMPEHLALNQPLTPFALASLDVLDPDSPDYALDVISVFEASLDDPGPVLHAQTSQAKGEAVAAMKADGIEYDERMELLEEITYPKPLNELLQAAYETYVDAQPWVRDYPLRPKSVVRDMWERAMTFNEYVSHYKLTRSEGVVLRYLTDAYRTVRSSIPEWATTDEVETLVEWLGEMIRHTDSSLLDEWEDLVAGGDEDEEDVRPVTAAPRTLTDNERAFTAMVRNALFRRVELAARDDVDALGALDRDAGWNADKWADALDDYFDTYDDIGIDTAARGARYFMVTKTDVAWHIRQIFADPEGDNDWGISATVDLPASDEAGAPVITVTNVGPA